MSDDKLEKVWSIIDDIKICMMTTRDDDVLRARPMQSVPRRDEHALYFFADVRDHKDEEVWAHPETCLAFQSESSKTYLSVSGRTIMLNDRVKMQELFVPAAKAYFPDGTDDPNMRLLRFTPDQAEYWDSHSSRIVTAVKMVSAIVTGERPDLGDNEKVSAL